MPGLLVALSLAAFAVMALTGATSKTPSPTAPPKLPTPSPAPTLAKAISQASAGMKPGDKKLFTFEGGRYGIKAETGGTFVAGPLMKKGEAWLVTFDVTVSPGVKFDKQKFQKTLIESMSTSIDVKSFNWTEGLTAQAAIIPKVDLDQDLTLKLGVPTSVAPADMTASITVTDARRVPAVA